MNTNETSARIKSSNMHTHTHTHTQQSQSQSQQVLPESNPHNQRKGGPCFNIASQGARGSTATPPNQTKLMRHSLHHHHHHQPKQSKLLRHSLHHHHSTNNKPNCF